MREERVPRSRHHQAFTRGTGAHPLHPEFSPDFKGMSHYLENDTILSEQFYRSPHSAHISHGAVALMYAVLEEALDCFQKGLVTESRRPRRLASEAEQWIFTDDHRWPFSFVNVCAALGLEPEYIRLGLKRRRQRSRLYAARGGRQFKLSA